MTNKWRLCDPIDGPRGKTWIINGPAEVPGFMGESDCQLAEVFSSEANARMMVAAPDLVKAAKELLLELAAYQDKWDLPKMDDPDLDQARDTLGAVIAKGTGEK